MRKLRPRDWILLVCILVALIITGLIATRAIRRAYYWRQHKDEPIRAWMSVRYVARSHRVPPAVLYQAIGAEPTQRDRRPLRDIAAQQKRPVSELISELQEAIVDYKSTHPPPDDNQPRKGGSSP
jgi:hypothetical protein